MAPDRMMGVVEVPAQHQVEHLASAYMEMPDEKTVMMANVMALSARVFSSNRMRRYLGTERALLP